MAFYYAGVGSRETPPDVQEIMSEIARRLEKRAWILRTGGAQNADHAFMMGCAVENQEIYLPWAKFNGITSKYKAPTPVALGMAQAYHPAWEKLSQGGQKLHARNMHIMLGPRCNDPVKFMVCWTAGGKVQGGTGQALRVAEDFNIPVFNLGARYQGQVLNDMGALVRSLTPSTEDDL